MPAGFADGWAGIAWALAHTGRPHFAEAARRALDRHRAEATTPGWCRGAAGLLVAGSGEPGAHAQAAAHALLTRPVSRDLSLCHGELGILDSLTAFADRTGNASVRTGVRRRAGLVLGAIDRYGLSCGTPGGVPTPGLLSGWAGIGYGLLRLGFAQRVPSVLLLQPGRVLERNLNHA
jgi:lantibiotic modifying enzyme